MSQNKRKKLSFNLSESSQEMLKEIELSNQAKNLKIQVEAKSREKKAKSEQSVRIAQLNEEISDLNSQLED